MEATADKIQGYETYTLKSLKVRLGRRFGAATLAKTSVEFEHILDAFADEVDVRITSYIFGLQQPTTYTVEVLVPKNWWEHLKETYFTEWWERRWPVQYKTMFRDVTFDHWALLPGFDKIPPGYEIQMYTTPYFDDPAPPDGETNTKNSNR